MKKQATCGGCHGVIHGTRRFSLETSIANHLPNCPSRNGHIKVAAPAATSAAAPPKKPKARKKKK